MESDLPVPEPTVEEPEEIAMLREQLRACHDLAKKCFAKSKTEDDLYYGVKYGRLTLGARLIKTSTALALALDRLEKSGATAAKVG